MSTRLPPREAPTARELLSRATWADLDRIAARYAVTFSGRRRELAVERLAGLLERPDQLQAAERLLPEATRAVLGLLMLVGAVDDERALAVVRDRLLSVRPELGPVLGRAYLPREVQTLSSLGLCFIDRRKLVVPTEVLQALPCHLPIGAPGGRPTSRPRAYAELAYLLSTLLTALKEEPPIAVQGQRVVDRGSVYQPLLLTPDAAAQLGDRLDIPAQEVVLLLALLESVGAAVVARGRWQVQHDWLALSAQPPYERLARLVEAWQQPRALTDLGRTQEFVWRCGPSPDCMGQVGQHEAIVRTLIWRWIGWSGGASIDIDSLCQTFAALHLQLLQTTEERGAWIAPNRGRAGTADDAVAVARVWLRQLLQQLHGLGLVVVDETSCGLSSVGITLVSRESPEQPDGPSVVADGGTTLRVEPLAAPPKVVRLIELSSHMLPADGAVARYAIEPVGLSRLQEQGISIDMFISELTAAGADLGPLFRAQLHQWAARAGRVRLHRPLTVLMTAEDAPLEQLLVAAGVADAAEVVGPGCALIEPERVDAAIEQLRARGFWPTIGG